MVDFIDDSDKLALGSDFVKKIDKINKETFETKEEVKKVNQKLPQLSNLKQASEGKLTSESALNLMRSIESTVVLATQETQKTMMKQFSSVDTEIKRTLDLLASPNEDAQDAALDRIEAIAKMFKVDMNEIVGAMDKNTQDLIVARQFQRDEKRQQQQLKEQIVQERMIVRDELRERGINTVLDKDNLTLKIQTFSEEKKEKREVLRQEKELQERTKENNREIKELRSKTVLKDDERKKLDQLLIKKQDEIQEQKKLDKKKEELNIKPTERSRGFFSETFGAAFESAKNTFGELKDMGGDLMKGFKNIPSLFSNLGKGLSGAGAGLLKFGVAAAKGVGIGLVIGLVILGLLKLYLAFQRIKEKISNFFSLGKSKETAPSVNQNEIVTGESGAPDNTSQNVSDKAMAPDSNITNQYTTDKSIKNTISEENATDNIIQQERQNKGVSRMRPMIQPIPKPLNVNKMSSDLMAAKETKPSSNVIAPSSNNNIITNNTTQSLLMTPLNTDRSFINLNTVPV